MKYFWLEKYKNLNSKLLLDLTEDLSYFLTMPKNYLKIYEVIKEKEINELLKSEKLVVLFCEKKDIKKLKTIINELLLIPDTNLPIIEGSLKEKLTDIKSIKNNLPIPEKLEINNIAACYTCLNIFYVDSIKSINKKGLCLCPFCLNTTMYFDNDYLPMNHSFLKLAEIYYGTSKLGSKFKDIANILIKKIDFNESNATKVDMDFSNIKKITSSNEEIILKELYDYFKKIEDAGENEVAVVIPKLDDKITYDLSFLLVLTLTKILTEAFYLNRVSLNFKEKEDQLIFKKIVKEIVSFK